MPRQNSTSDDGRSLTPDLKDEASRAQQNQRYPPAPRTPSDPAPAIPPKLRASVQKVIRLHRTSTALSTARSAVGAEPGIDPRRESAIAHFSDVREACVIDVVDYSTVRSSAARMTNAEFVEFMGAGGKSEPWAKVRWINVGGISWDVVSALAIKYDLHPLALEDVLHSRGHGSRSKADYYPQHLFIRILCHSLASIDEELPSTVDPLEAAVVIPRSESPTVMTRKEMTLAADLEEREAPPTRRSTMTSRFSTVVGRGLPVKEEDADTEEQDRVRWEDASSRASINTAAHQRLANEITINELKKGERVDVNVRPMYIFLTREGTIISIHSTPDLEFTVPIASRLRQRDTVLRMSTDPSLLVQSLLDLTVDRAMEVIDEYQGTLLRLEQDVLLHPKMKTIRYLHILSEDLMLHKRTLEPIRSVVYGLRRYDQDRCAALIDTADSDAPVEVEGFMSSKAKTYLAGVLDHMEHILASLDMFEKVTENLIDYTFNMKSWDMNEVMRRLTTTTIICLPLTFLTGYFGMNFVHMFTVKTPGHTDVIFWIIALPVMAIVLVLFLWSDMQKAWHYLKKKTVVRKAVEVYYKRL